METLINIEVPCKGTDLALYIFQSDVGYDEFDFQTKC